MTTAITGRSPCTGAAAALAALVVLQLQIPFAEAAASLPTQTQESVELLRPQSEPLRYTPPVPDPQRVPAAPADAPRVTLPVPDRWRIMERLGQRDHWWDPYNINTFKGDKPYPGFATRGPDWFLNLSAVSDSLVELRRLPTAVGAQSTKGFDALNTFGRDAQWAVAQTFVFGGSVIKGNTTFKPPDFELKLSAAAQVNHTRVAELRVLNVDPQKGNSRTAQHLGLQEAFLDIHLRNVSDRYDFDSLRLGIQPFISDFRGFLYHDLPVGVRLFGNRDDNRWQYNLAWFRRLEKDTHSGLNDLTQRWRADQVLVANLYRQDWPVLGHTTQATLLYNRNREGRQGPYVDRNGFQVRPAVLGQVRPQSYDVVYAGLHGDGHFGTFNLTSSAYLAMGSADHAYQAGNRQRVLAGFLAAEVSRDFDWLRLRGSAAMASADRDPHDGTAHGFDAILENPQFAGSDTSFWIRQSVPLIGGGGVALSGRNGLLVALRSSKDQGQSNFVNPGLVLIGAGADADLTPEWRLIANLSLLSMGNPKVLEVLRSQGRLARFLGTDVSIALQHRPFMSQNAVVNVALAALVPGSAFKQLYAASRMPYSFVTHLLLSF